MGRDNRQEALTYLLKQAENQGYVTFDNIMDCADANSLPIVDFDWITSAITTRGILIYDEEPTNRITQNQYDDFDDYAQSDYEAVYTRIVSLDNSLKDFVDEVRNIVPPQWRELNTLKYQVQEGNQHARTRMIEMHLRIALRIALQRAETYDMDIADAVGEACVGLITAVDKYNPDNNGAFGSYASMWILQNLQRTQPLNNKLVYYPAHAKESYFLAYPILKKYGYIGESCLYNKEEIVMLLCEKLSYSLERIEKILDAIEPIDSLEEIMLEKNDERTKLIKEKISYDAEIEKNIELYSLRKQISNILGTLSIKERNIIELRFGLIDKKYRTLEEVGEIFNVSRERIRQIEMKAIRKLKHTSIMKKIIDFW